MVGVGLGLHVSAKSIKGVAARLILRLFYSFEKGFLSFKFLH